MQYIRLYENIVMEIIPAEHPDFPGMSIEQRYSAEFIAKLLKVDDSVPVQENWKYDPDTQTFEPQPEDVDPPPPLPEPVPPEQIPTWEVLKKENEKLHKQVEALEQQSAFHENLFMELSQEVYA